MIGVSRSKADWSPSLHWSSRLVTLPMSGETLLTGAGPVINASPYPVERLSDYTSGQLNHCSTLFVTRHTVSKLGIRCIPAQSQDPKNCCISTFRLHKYTPLQHWGIWVRLRTNKSKPKPLLPHWNPATRNDAQPWLRSALETPLPSWRAFSRLPSAGLQAKARRMGTVIYFVDESVVGCDAHRDTTWGKIGKTLKVCRIVAIFLG